MKHSPWFVPLAGTADAPRRVVAFPYSGASAHAYARWRDWISPDLELLGVQLAGRGMRMGEPLAADMDQLVAGILPSLLALPDKPYYLFGHSNGALMAFAVLNALLGAHARAPEAVILSAKRSPTVPFHGERYSTLPESRFLQALRDLGGTPPELLDHPEMMRLFGPIIRADFALGDTYSLGAIHPQIATLPALVLAGQGDRMAVDDVFAWAELFPLSRLVTLEGGHFCIDQDPAFAREMTGLFAQGAMPGGRRASAVRSIVWSPQ